MSAVVKLPRAFKALDMPVTFTHFKDLKANTKTERELKHFRDLVEIIDQTQGKTKAALPLLSFAKFGDKRTDKGSYRHDANVIRLYAITGDHDHGTMTIEEGQSRLARYSIAAMFHTTPSHTASAPRWRVFCPLMKPVREEEYKALAGLLNGFLSGELAAQSFVLSQSYYYGHVEGVEYQTAIVDTADTLDMPDRYMSEVLPRPIYPERQRDDSRSGKAARLARQMKLIDRKTYIDFCDAVDADPELAAWREDNRSKQGSDRQMSRVWNLIAAPAEYDEELDYWLEPAGELRNGGQYKMKSVEWIWPGWLARGKLHILGGRKSGGKSTVFFSLAAAVTTGGEFPDGTTAPLGDVVIWSSDAIDDTILPRIAAMGGDITRVHFVDHVAGDDGKPRGFDPAIDMPILAELTKSLPNLVLVGIDPIVSASRADSHKNAETRIGLQPVVDFAEKRNVAIVGITHFTKNTQGRDPVERITGTLAYGALARVVMGVAADIEDMATPRRLVRIASNIGPTGDGFEYTLEQKEVDDHNITNQAVTWGAPITGSALSLITEVEGEPGHHKGSRKEAIAFLTDKLVGAKDGIRTKELRAEWIAGGRGWRSVEGARAELPIEIVGMGVNCVWVWVDAEDPRFNDDEPL